MSDVVLVSMPYAAVEHPSIALGYLTSALKRRGIATHAVNANVLFAKEIGLRNYFLFSNYYNSDLLGEWTFSEAAFPEFAPDHDTYFAGLRLPLEQEKIWRIRRQAGPFIEKLARQILEERPRIVGCSSVFAQNCASLALLREIRALAPDVVTVIGGANCESEMGSALHRNFEWLDYVFSGESDELFPDLCERLLRGDPAQPHPAVLAPANRGNGNRHSVARATIADLNRLPPLDYDDYFRDLRDTALQRLVMPGLLVETSRGCWWGEKNSCTFCGLNGDCLTYRSKDARIALDEIHDLSKRYGISTFEAVDNILDMSYFRTFLPALAGNGHELRFLYEVKANLTRDEVRMLSDAGVAWIQPGIEGLQDDVLKLLRKGTTACQNLQLLKWAREFGVYVIWNYLCDIPRERDEWHRDVLDLLPLIVHLQPPAAPGSPLRFDRFSAYHDTPGEWGLELRPAWTYRYIYPVGEPDLCDIAYFFDNLKPDVLNGGCERPHWTAAHHGLVAWRRLHYENLSEDFYARVAKNTPMLGMTESDGALVLHDTRPCAPAPRVELRGLAARIYEICDAGRPARAVLDECRGSGHPDATAADVDRVLAELVEAKVMVRVSGRHLSLAVRMPWRAYAPMDCFPGGRLLLRRAAPPKTPDDLTVEDVYGIRFDAPVASA